MKNTLDTNPNQIYSSASVYQDVIFLLIRTLVVITLIFLGYLSLSTSTPDYLFGILYTIIGAVYFTGTIRRGFSIYQYQKSRSYINGRYLRGVKPQCPYLRVDRSGFQCLIEFNRDFNIESDLPLCHGSEEKFRAHWVEKAPGIFEKTKKETNPRRKVHWITLLAQAKYPPALPLIREMVAAPIQSPENRYIVQYLLKNPESSIDQIFEKYEKLFQQNNEEGIRPLLDPEDLRLSLEKNIERLLNYGVMSSVEVEGIVQYYLTEKGKNPSLSLFWNIDASSDSKNIAIMALSHFKDEEDVLPDLIAALEESLDFRTDQIIIKAITQLDAAVIPKLIKLAKNDKLAENKRCNIISTLGQMESEEPLEFLSELVQTTDNDLIRSYSITALGKLPGGKGILKIVQILMKAPDDLALSAGRAALSGNIEESLPIIFDSLNENNLTDDYLDIVASIFEDIQHYRIFEYIKNLPKKEEQEKILSLIQKYELIEHLDSMPSLSFLA